MVTVAITTQIVCDGMSKKKGKETPCTKGMVVAGDPEDATIYAEKYGWQIGPMHCYCPEHAT